MPCKFRHEFINAASQGELNEIIKKLDQKTVNNVHLLMEFGEYNKVDEESDYYGDNIYKLNKGNFLIF